MLGADWQARMDWRPCDCLAPAVRCVLSHQYELVALRQGGIRLQMGGIRLHCAYRGLVGPSPRAVWPAGRGRVIIQTE